MPVASKMFRVFCSSFLAKFGLVHILKNLSFWLGRTLKISDDSEPKLDPQRGWVGVRQPERQVVEAKSVRPVQPGFWRLRIVRCVMRGIVWYQ